MASVISPDGIQASQYFMRGWGWSLLLHLGVLMAVALLGLKMTPVVEQDPFQWEVALVQPAAEPPQTESASVPAVQPAKPAPVRTLQTPQPVQPVEPASDMAMTCVAPQVSPQVVHPAVVPPKPEPADSREIWLSESTSVPLLAYEVVADSDVEGMHPDEVAQDLDLLATRCFALIRNHERQLLSLDTRLQAGDIAWYIVPEEQVDTLAKRFAETGHSLSLSQSFFGEFVVNPASLAGDLADAYGLVLSEEERRLTLRSLFKKRFEGVPVEGDRVAIGDAVAETESSGEVPFFKKL